MLDWKGFSEDNFVVLTKGILEQKDFIKEYGKNLIKKEIDTKVINETVEKMHSKKVYFRIKRGTNDVLICNFNKWEGTNIINWSGFMKMRKEDKNV